MQGSKAAAECLELKAEEYLACKSWNVQAQIMWIWPLSIFFHIIEWQALLWEIEWSSQQTFAVSFFTVRYLDSGFQWLHDSEQIISWFWEPWLGLVSQWIRMQV
jgi:hypothetical protein